MLMPAQLYKDELRAELLRSWYKPENIYWSGWTGDEITDLPENNYDMHCFVSIDKNGKVVGYISYSVNWVAMNADRFGIINFDKGNLTFAKDLYQAICDLFEKYHMNRIEWIAFADNPAIRGYRNFIRKHGGKECGYKRQHAKLQDGKLHDSIEFEILASEFKKSEFTKPYIDFEHGDVPKRVQIEKGIDIVLAWRPMAEPYNPERSDNYDGE